MFRSKRRMAAFALVIALGTACAGYFGPRPGVIYAGMAPPTPYGEVIIAPPGRGYAWQPGHFVWRVREYVWLPGMWVEVAPGYSDWAPGRWSRDPHGWFWIEGRWR